MAHHRITIIGTEEQYDKVYEYLLRKENPGYYDAIENGKSEIGAYYNWDDFYSIGGSDWVKLEETKITKQEYIDKHLPRYFKWYNESGDRDGLNYYLLDVREAETDLENIDLEFLFLSEFIERIKTLPEDVNIMIADSHW